MQKKIEDSKRVGFGSKRGRGCGYASCGKGCNRTNGQEKKKSQGTANSFPICPHCGKTNQIGEGCRFKLEHDKVLFNVTTVRIFKKLSNKEAS